MIAPQAPVVVEKDAQLKDLLTRHNLEALLDAPVVLAPVPMEGARIPTAARYLPTNAARLQCPALTKLGYRRMVETVEGGFKVWLEMEDRVTMKRFAERITSPEFLRAAA